MSVSARFEEKHAFVLFARDVVRLWSLLEESCGSVRAEASCSNGIQRIFTTPDELVSYENPRARSIKTLTISARNEGYTRHASVTLGIRYSSSIEVSIVGPEDIVVKAKNSFGEVFDGMKPWYSTISRIDFYIIVMTIVLFAFVFIQLIGAGSGESQPLKPDRAFLLTAITLLGFASIAVLIWLLNSLRARFFPLSVFALGQGQARYEFDDKVRWVVIVGLAVSIVASLITAILLGSP